MDYWEEKNGMHYDKEGREINMREWCKLFEDFKYKIIRKTKVGKREVSTVWLGLDHGFGNILVENPDYKPVIFETMVFPECDEMDRYCTLEDAIVGHENMVDRVKKL